MILSVSGEFVKANGSREGKAPWENCSDAEVAVGAVTRPPWVLFRSFHALTENLFTLPQRFPWDKVPQLQVPQLTFMCSRNVLIHL